MPPNSDVPTNFTAGAWYNSGEMRSYNDAGAALRNFTESGLYPDDFVRQHRWAYFAATSFLDAQVGKVLDALEKYGFANNTVVALISDHGWHLGDNHSFGKCTNFQTATNHAMVSLLFAACRQARAVKIELKLMAKWIVKPFTPPREYPPPHRCGIFLEELKVGGAHEWSRPSTFSPLSWISRECLHCPRARATSHPPWTAFR
jgi:hypothetical protein